MEQTNDYPELRVCRDSSVREGKGEYAGGSVCTDSNGQSFPLSPCSSGRNLDSLDVWEQQVDAQSIAVAFPPSLPHLMYLAD
jgi:hypothetical protein